MESTVKIDRLSKRYDQSHYFISFCIGTLFSRYDERHTFCQPPNKYPHLKSLLSILKYGTSRVGKANDLALKFA